MTWYQQNFTLGSHWNSLLYMFDDKNYVSDVTETIVVDCFTVIEIMCYASTVSSPVIQCTTSENWPAFTINLVLLKCEVDHLFTFMVRVHGCMCGGRRCLCVVNVASYPGSSPFFCTGRRSLVMRLLLMYVPGNWWGEQNKSGATLELFGEQSYVYHMNDQRGEHDDVIRCGGVTLHYRGWCSVLWC